MRFQSIFYPESTYGGFTDIDGTIAFYLRVNSLLRPSFVVLDFGCGTGSYQEDPIDIRRSLRVLRGKVATVIGLDVDPNAQYNPFIDHFHLLDSDRWPITHRSIDLCLCDHVLEHLTAPRTFFAETARVLKPNGYLCIRTPNAWNYIALLSRCIPNRYHARVLAKVQEKRKTADVYPTFYKCNTIPRLRALLTEYGFDHVVYGYEAEPSYLSFSKWAYWLGVLHQRFAPSFLRASLFAFAQLRKHYIR